MKPTMLAAVMAAALAASFGTARAEPVELQWWHAMTAINLERVNKIATDLNASRSAYKVSPVYKGSYPETASAAASGPSSSRSWRRPAFSCSSSTSSMPSSTGSE
jgi:sn-glycerol 3-phosphate transport system substrate-binding protein